MKITEVREGFIKFESNRRVSLSSFILIKDVEKNYIAQVIQTRRAGEAMIAYGKILFLYDTTIRPYDKTLPAKNSELQEFTYDLLNKSIEYKKPVVAGKFIDNDINILLDKSCFDKKLLACIDNSLSKKIIVNNITKQFESIGNIVTIDMFGELSGNKFVAGIDFKLPLNTESLEFMFEDCLNDATSDSKSLIKEIFQDLSEYSQTVPFLPFQTLKSIVDDMVDKSHVFKLLVLKNKLAKFDKLGYFAATEKEAKNLETILKQKNVVIDLTKLDPTFQNRYISVIYSTLQKCDNRPQVLINASNALSKKTLKTVLTEDKVSSALITHSKFKYINEIKTMFDNFIIEPSFSANEVFKIFANFLQTMPAETYLIAGEGTNYIPLVSILKEFEPQENIVSQPIPTSEEVLMTKQPNNTEEDNKDAEVILDLKNNDNKDTDLVDVSSHSVAIEKKSEEFIEKITEEIENNSIKAPTNLFENEQEELDETTSSPVEQVLEKNGILEESSTNDFESELLDFNEIPDEEVKTETIVEISEEELSLSELREVENIEINVDVEDFSTETLAEELTENIPTETLENFSTKDFELETDTQTEIEEPEVIEVSEDISEYTEQIEMEEENESIIEDSDNQEAESMIEETEDETILDVIPVSNDDIYEIKDDENLEIENFELEENDVIIDITEDGEELSESELLDKQIVEDVDKVFTTIKEDSLSDSDLDFIDELNEEHSEFQEALETEEPIEFNDSIEELPDFTQENEEDELEILEPLKEVSDDLDRLPENREVLETKSASTPIVPVYDADIPQEDLVISDDIEQGDTVVHAKYGSGIVEKMIKYGTKTLYSINFDNIGRRLLDPTLTEIKKVS